MYKVIFLDFDGVINTFRVKVARPMSCLHSFDPIAIEMLNRLSQLEPSLRFVISSSWRINHSVREVLVTAGFFGPLFGEGKTELGSWKTPRISDKQRGDEIASWLNLYGDKVSHYVILDDDSDMLPEQLDNFIKTDTYDGLSFQNYLDIKRILQMGDKEYG